MSKVENHTDPDMSKSTQTIAFFSNRAKVCLYLGNLPENSWVEFQNHMLHYYHFWTSCWYLLGLAKKKIFEFSGALCTIRRSPFFRILVLKAKSAGGGGHSPLYALLMTFTHEYIYLHRALMVTSFSTMYIVQVRKLSKVYSLIYKQETF